MKKVISLSIGFLALSIGIVVFVLPSNVDALQCQNGTTTTYQQSWFGCFGATDASSCGGFCSGGWCYEPQTTPTYQTCPNNTSGSCSYSSTCDESGDVTSTIYSCGSSTQGCISSTSTESGACSRNTNGQSCGTNQVCSGGSCVTSCVSNQGQSCNINACGQAGGTIQCDGSCSGSTPATPYTIGAACNRNSCGGTGTITNACTGACSASPPIIYTLGESCTSSPNACGATNGTITDSCSGTCTPPSNPATCVNNVGESGYQCPSGCTAPPAKTLSVSVTATPSSGPAPLKNVKIDAFVGGTATGTITYKLDCTNDGAFDDSATSSSTSFTFTKKCDYNSAGSYTAKVEVTRQTLKATDTETISVASISLAADPSASTVAAKTNVTYTAISGFDVGPTPYYIRIYEGTTQKATCSTGTTCSYTTSDTNRTRTFIAEIQDSSNNTIAASSSISTTWQAAVQCAAPQSLSCAYNSSSKTLTLSWGSVANVKDYFFEWAKWGSGYTFCFFPGCTADSKTVNTTFGTTSSLSTNTTYKLHVRAETAQGNTCAAPGPFSQEVECYTGICGKQTSPLISDSFQVPVTTSNGTKQCNITLTHQGADLTDNKDVSTDTKSFGTNARTIGLDDDPVTGCNDNLIFTNTWTLSTGAARIDSGANNKDAAHDLSFGYNLGTSGCVIASVTRGSDCSSDPQSKGENACNTPVVSADKTTATKNHGVQDLDTGVYSNFTYNLVECTQNSQCSSYTDKRYCNGGETRTITGVSVLPLNTCIDSVPPTSTFSSETQFKNTTDSNKAPGYDRVQQRYWLKAGNWSIPITDADDNSGVDTATCQYKVRDIGTGTTTSYKTRTCNSSLTLIAGPTGDCRTQGANQCEITIKTLDKAGNIQESSGFFSIDYTAPTAQ